MMSAKEPCLLKSQYKHKYEAVMDVSWEQNELGISHLYAEFSHPCSQIATFMCMN